MDIVTGDGRRQRQQRDDQDQPHHLDQQHHGHGHQTQQQQIEKRDRHAAQTRELLVEGDGQELTIEERDRGHQHQIQPRHPPEFARRRQQDVTEQKAHQVRGIPWCLGDEEHADRHADGPERADERVFLGLPAQTHRPDQQRREDGRDQRPGEGIGPEIERRAHAAEHRMRDPAGHEGDALDDDEGADHATADAGQKTRDQRAL